jgi:hypothetical protein
LGCSSLFQRESQDHQFADLEHSFVVVVVVVAVVVRGELDWFGRGLQNFSGRGNFVGVLEIFVLCRKHWFCGINFMSCVFSLLFIFLFLLCAFPALEFRFLRYFEVHFSRVSSSFLFSSWVRFFGFLDSS